MTSQTNAQKVDESLWVEMKEYGVSLALVEKVTKQKKLGPKQEGFHYRYIQMVISLRTRYNADIENIAKNLVKSIKTAYELAA